MVFEDRCFGLCYVVGNDYVSSQRLGVQRMPQVSVHLALQMMSDVSDIECLLRWTSTTVAPFEQYIATGALERKSIHRSFYLTIDDVEKLVGCKLSVMECFHRSQSSDSCVM